jgi:U3 small nucleolar ribonucleoprotein component
MSETDENDRRSLAELKDGDTLRIADEAAIAALLRDHDRLTSTIAEAHRYLDSAQWWHGDHYRAIKEVLVILARK